LSLRSPEQPIGDDVLDYGDPDHRHDAGHGRAHGGGYLGSIGAKALSLASFVFMGLLAGVTSCNHFVILTMSGKRLPACLKRRCLSFKWPSVAYAVDILSWDVFFPLSMLFAAPIFSGSRLASTIRLLMIASGALALAGLSGVVVGDMQLRNIGIIGYVPVFLVVAVLLAVLFQRTGPVAAPASGA
jgi:hypothetical protein